MIRRPVIIQKDMAKEEHPIALLVQEASQYESQVYIEVDNKKINAKSIMGMMSLQLEKGLNITVVSDGNDEEAAASGVENFLAAHA
ncbi:HPr family phosphocarrier protein [uncultured Merdimonas sp.]|uniref:HPr family phosphocarrier protein n=1 Tax=uncultured Merdimonas sp. TaxID=2023269 RepID=UPI003207BB9F